jgi:hypothetical protein
VIRLLLAVLIVVAGCGDSDACDGALFDALYLEVLDAETGEPIEATVVVEQDGEPVAVSCSRRRTSSEPCLTWAAGPMLTGTFVVSISAEDHEPMMETVEVTAGECGPNSVELEYVLAPSAPIP